jgi:tetratricopeptide (TPR) repeat protein
MKLLKLLILSIFLTGGFPLSDLASLQAESSEQQKKKRKKKKKSSKKSSSKKKKKKKKKSSSKKKKKSSSKKKKKSSSKKKKKSENTGLEESGSTAESIESPSTSNKSKRSNSAAYADELFTLTGELQSSNKELARATRYFNEQDIKPKSVSVDNKPFFTTDDFEKESRLNPDNIYIQRQLGLHYESKGDYDSAKEVYLREVSKNPQNPDSHYFLGSLYANLGEMQKAKFSFEEALYLDPNHGATIEAISMFMGSQEKKDLGNDLLMYSSKKAPDGPAKHIASIREAMAGNNYIEALNLSEEASQKYPEQTGFVQLIGENQLKLGRVEEAKRSFQRAIKLDPKEVKPHVSLADLYFEQGKYVYAALSYSDAVYIDPDNSDYRYMQGLSYFNAQEWGRTASSWEDLLNYRPNDPMVKSLLPQAYYIMAVEFNRVGNPSMGRQAFKNALSVNNNHSSWLPGAMAVLGKYYRQKNMYNESLVAYQEVLELTPNNADAYRGMGITYWEMDEKQLARASWERSLEIKPDNNESKGWLILSSQGS